MMSLKNTNVKSLIMESVQAVSGWECSSQMSLFWMVLIDQWSAGIFKMCSTLWRFNDLECCQPPAGVSWCSGYSLRRHYRVQGFTVARVVWKNKTKQQNSNVVTVVVTVISSTSSSRRRRHATESRRSLAGSLWRIPAPVRACLEPSDRIPARLSAVDEDARLTDLGFCHWAGTGTQRGQRPRRGGSALTCIEKKRGAVTNLFAPHRELLQQTIAEEWSWLQVGTEALPEWCGFFFFSSLRKTENFPLHLLSPLKMGDTQVAATFKVLNSTHNTWSSTN